MIYDGKALVVYGVTQKQYGPRQHRGDAGRCGEPYGCRLPAGRSPD
jgi:hypothetical protein